VSLFVLQHRVSIKQAHAGALDSMNSDKNGFKFKARLKFEEKKNQQEQQVLRVQQRSISKDQLRQTQRTFLHSEIAIGRLYKQIQ
jgi:hypothetical protein